MSGLWRPEVSHEGVLSLSTHPSLRAGFIQILAGVKSVSFEPVRPLPGLSVPVAGVAAEI